MKDPLFVLDGFQRLKKRYPFLALLIAGPILDAKLGEAFQSKVSIGTVFGCLLFSLSLSLSLSLPVYQCLCVFLCVCSICLYLNVATYGAS